MGFRVHPQGHSGAAAPATQPVAGHGPARPVCVYGKDQPVALHATHPCGGGAGRGHATSTSRPKAASRRGSRATPQNYNTLIDGMARTGLHAVSGSCGAGAHHRHLSRAGRSEAYDFKTFYAMRRAQRGFILYPGKLTQAGDISRRLYWRDWSRRDASRPCNAVELARCRTMGIASGEPAHLTEHRRKANTMAQQNPPRGGRRAQVRQPTRSRSPAATSTASCAASTCTRTSSSAPSSLTRQAASASATWCWAGT